MIYCPYLWKSQCILSNSKVLPCCHSTAEKWSDLDFADGINTQAHKEARMLLSNDIWPKECTVCKENENKNIKSPRQRAIEFFDTSQDGTINIDYLDIKFDNTCNLSCRMCNPTSSSMIEKMYVDKDIQSIPRFLQDHHNIVYSNLQQQDKKIEHVKDCITNGLKHLKVTGGEPFASRHFLDLLKWCKDNNYEKNIGLSITTNGTKYNKSLLSLLTNFKYTSFVVSVDGTGKIYDYIRHGASWQKLLDNCNMFDSFFQDKKEKLVKNNNTIHIATVLQFYNLFDICNLVDWCYTRGYILKLDINLKPKESELKVDYLPKDIKCFILDECDRYLKIYQDVEWAKTVLLNLKNLMIKTMDLVDTDKHKQLKNTVILQDTMYAKDYKQYLHKHQVQFLDNIT